MLKLVELQIMKKLLNNQNLDLKEISKFFRISPTQVKNHIVCIDKFLQISMDSRIKKENDKYSIINYGKISNYLDTLPIITSERSTRIDYILVKLIIERQINLTEISTTLDVTKITIYSDMKCVKKILKVFNLSIISFKWKGTELIGKEKEIFRFSIEFFTKILSLDFCENNLYSSITNYKLGEYLKNYISIGQVNLYRLFVKEIVLDFEYTPDFYQFNSFVATLIYSLVCENYTEELNSLKLGIPNEIFNKYRKIVEKNKVYNQIGLKKLNPFICILSSNDKTFFYSKNIFDNLINLSCFINEIQNLFNIKFSLDEKIYINTLLTTSIFKKRYFLSDYLFLDMEKFDDKFYEFKIIVNKYYLELYDEDIHQLYNYLIDIKNKIELEEKNLKKVILVDKSMNLWLGEKLKKLLIQNFNFIIVNVRAYHNIQNRNKAYDFMIFINSLPNSDDKKIFKVCYMGENYIDLKKFNFLSTLKLIFIYFYTFLIHEEFLICLA